MITMLKAMFEIELSWLFLGVMFAGLGHLATRVMRIRTVGLDGCLNRAWVGWALMLGFLQLWHLLQPVNGVAFVIVTTAGTVGAVWMVLDIVRQAKESLNSEGCGVQKRWIVPLTLLLAFGVFSLWVANHAIGPIIPYDAGLYHLGSVKWLSSYPIVPGLGNLHHRFSNISAHFLYLAWVERVPWVYRGFTVGASFLIVLSMAQCLVSVGRVIGRRSVGVHDALRVLLLARLVQHAAFESASTSPDVPIYLLGYVIAVEMCRILFDRTEAMESKRRRWLFMVLLSCAGVTAKMTFLFLGFTACAVVFVVLVASSRRVGMFAYAVIAGFVTLSMLAPWFARNVISCGYPFYHSSLFPWNVEWRLPENVLKTERGYLKSWPIKPGAPPAEVLANWDWVWPWFKGVVTYWYLEVTVPMVMAIVGIAALMGGGIRRWGSEYFWKAGAFLLPGLVSLIAWFLLAPDQRYAGATFWWLGGGAIAIAAAGGTLHQVSFRRTMVILGYSLILTVAFHFRMDKFNSPGPDQGYYPLPTASLKEYVTQSGLKLYVPSTRDQCWDGPLPGTPYPNTEIRLRRAGDLASGFVVDREQ